MYYIDTRNFQPFSVLIPTSVETVLVNILPLKRNIFNSVRFNFCPFDGFFKGFYPVRNFRYMASFRFCYSVECQHGLYALVLLW